VFALPTHEPFSPAETRKRWAGFPISTVALWDLKWVLLRGDLGAREIKNLKSVDFELNGYGYGEALGFLK
jgi:hypothetical protein